MEPPANCVQNEPSREPFGNPVPRPSCCGDPSEDAFQRDQSSDFVDLSDDCVDSNFPPEYEDFVA
eukprot:14438218-Alexandrium_andersonii.AAC.1